jgi:hypothetical protein
MQSRTTEAPPSRMPQYLALNKILPSWIKKDGRRLQTHLHAIVAEADARCRDDNKRFL